MIPKIRSGIPRFHVENVIVDAERIIAPHNARTAPNKNVRSYLSIEPPSFN